MKPMPDSGADIGRFGIKRHRLRELVDDLLERRRGEIGEQCVELVTAKAPEDAAMFLGEDTSTTRKLLDKLVAMVVAIGIVELLEVVGIKKKAFFRPRP